MHLTDTDTDTEAGSEMEMRMRMQIRIRMREDVDTCLRNVSDAMQFYNNVFHVAVAVAVVVVVCSFVDKDEDIRGRNAHKHTRRTGSKDGGRRTRGIRFVRFGVCACANGINK